MLPLTPAFKLSKLLCIGILTISVANSLISFDIPFPSLPTTIPTGQDILGIQGEDNSATRYFLIPKINENGEDLSDKEFSIIIVDSGNNRSEIKIESPEITDNYIKLKLIIDKNITQISGNLNIQIQAISDNYVWKTFPAIFKIANSI